MLLLPYFRSLPYAPIAALANLPALACRLGCSAVGLVAAQLGWPPPLFFNKVKTQKSDSNPHHFHSYFLINVIELPYCLYTTFRQRYLLGLNQSLSQCTPTLHE